ncbi:hypothetical protein ACWD7T_31940, partial [Streptomyces sp. 900116325]
MNPARVGAPRTSWLPLPPRHVARVWRHVHPPLQRAWVQDVAHEINDIAFVGVVHPEHGPGF